MSTKICRGYKREKHECSLSDFYSHPTAKDGLDYLCKECRKLTTKEHRKPIEHRREVYRRWRIENKEKERESSKLEHRKMKESVILAYGAKCVCCGLDDIRFLTLDHINNDGAKHRLSINNRNIYRWARQNGYPNTLQLLCYNCNCAKSAFKGICPHETDKLNTFE